MEILVESILNLLPDYAQITCRRPTAKITGIKKLNDFSEATYLDLLYVSTDPDLFQTSKLHRGNFLLCSAEDLPADLIDPYSNLIVVHSLAEYVETIEKISDLLANPSSLDNISRKMITIIRNGGDVQQLIKFAYELLNNPLMLVDISFNLIAHVGTNMLKNEDSWNYAIDNKMFPSSYIGYVMSRPDDDDDQHLILGDIRVELPNEVTTVKQYSARISQNNIVLGYVKLLETNHPVTDFELHVFQLLSYYLPFTRTSTKGRIPDVVTLTDDFLLSLLEERITNKYEILTRQDLYNMKFYKYLYVISINFIGSHNSNDIISFTLQRIKSYFPNNSALWVNGRFIVLYDSNEENIVEDPNWSARFAQILEKLNCTANISTAFQELYEISNYYKQTLFCSKFRTLSQEHETRQILYYKDIFEYHMILALRNEVNLEDLLHPAVKILSQCKSSGADLLNTLFTYIHNHCSIPATAKTMYLHYNTLKNRINRIETLTGFTGEDNRECFWIYLSELILNVLNFDAQTGEYELE